MASATARNEAKRPMIFTCFSLQLKGDDDAGDQGGTSGTGHPAGGRGSHSAFQQLFPRARKLLEQQQQLHSLPQAHHHHPTMVEHHQERYTEFRAASSTPSAGIGRNAHSEQELK